MRFKGAQLCLSVRLLIIVIYPSTPFATRNFTGLALTSADSDLSSRHYLQLSGIKWSNYRSTILRSAFVGYPGDSWQMFAVDGSDFPLHRVKTSCHYVKVSKLHQFKALLKPIDCLQSLTASVIVREPCVHSNVSLQLITMLGFFSWNSSFQQITIYMSGRVLIHTVKISDSSGWYRLQWKSWGLKNNPSFQSDFEQPVIRQAQKMVSDSLLWVSPFTLQGDVQGYLGTGWAATHTHSCLRPLGLFSSR